MQFIINLLAENVAQRLERCRDELLNLCVIAEAAIISCCFE